ncbi:MAG: lipoyl synthase [Candidatus Omnitrophica bacterium]|nr:lipoyl synthase [Candidatus Omnitrophota bacterium]
MPYWLKKKLPDPVAVNDTKEYLRGKILETVCVNSRCPNIGECYSSGNVSFLIMGSKCTRSCAFCAIKHGEPEEIREREPDDIAMAVKDLALKYVVLTSVTRDDLSDGGSGHYANVVKAIKKSSPETVIETLVPDFNGNKDFINTVLFSGIDVFSHNIETVNRLYESVRPKFDYRRSLSVLSHASIAKRIIVKSGFMVGLGENEDEVYELMSDIRKTGCKLLTVGQYLKPMGSSCEVVEFVEPGKFARFEKMARDLGFASAKCEPFVRSSYKAAELLNSAR